ncbi:hypothetical protein [uncultured Desulfobulbus sp.]|uniref:hypothetical protein n=1 Tax=uncultured Desulfobulbus sp. TaxID=239745 RepID=UPI0029C786DC|nr:hypothetical protein [uncultured Desulfobulbus sp.]
MKYVLPLDSSLTEHIFAPFHDPEHSHWIPVQIDTVGELEIKRDTLWDSTVFNWSDVRESVSFSLLILAPFSTYANNEIIVCLSLPKEAQVEIALIDKDCQVCSAWSAARQGIGRRQEIILKVSELRGLRGLLRPMCGYEGLALRIVSTKTDVGILVLSWLGMRNSASHANTLKSRAMYRPDWSPWLLPHDAWGDISFERGLLFDESALEDVRGKLNCSGWREHFALLESRAAEYLKRDPEVDFGEYLPSHDTRYIRDSEHGKTAYHWESLVLAFVGLVKEDRTLIDHALRYLMCMVHTRSWTESAEHNISSSTWSHLSFMEEMTTTSVALLFDWLGFALLDRTKVLIRKALWEKGITPVMRDLSSREAMHQMNQGAVFCRAIVLGGLMLESGWPKFQGQIVDSAYESMCQVLNDYVKADGGVHEGVGYLCQTLTATLWTIIAHCRARGLEWKDVARQRFVNVGRYVAVMSASYPGKAIPVGDCRTEWFGGDAVPILSTLFPESPFVHILHNCLIGGWVHELTGTLAKSGGMIGMVYGPKEVQTSRPIVPNYDLLHQSGKVTLSFGGVDSPRARLWISGRAQGATHSHRDLGQFCLEIENESIFVDRGMVQYWFAEAHFLSRSWLHNVLTPLSADGDYLNQRFPSGADPIVVSEDHRRISVPGNNIWASNMDRYERRFVFDDQTTFSILDDFVLQEPGQVAFHLHSPMAFQVLGQRAILNRKGYRVEVVFPWAQKVECRETLIDLCHRPIFHLCAMSTQIPADQLFTQITIHAEAKDTNNK